MHLNRVTCASALVIGFALAPLSLGAGTAVAQPGPPCGPVGSCQGAGGPAGGPGGPGGPGPGGPGRHDGYGPGGPRPDGPGGPGPGGPGRPWGLPVGAPPAPPPGLGWRGIDQGRFDHQPFNYNGSWVSPIFNPDFDNWGFWFFGIWIPL